MKTIKYSLAAVLLSATVGGFALPAQAGMMGHVATYGPDVEAQFNGHTMKMQMVTDESGSQWVVMSAADAEAVFGKLPHSK